MSDSLFLLLCVLGVLITASTVGAVLQYRAARHGAGPNSTIENLNARINAWWVMVLVMAIAFLAGKVGVVILFALCSFAALREVLTLTNTRSSDHYALAAAVFIVLPIQYIAVGNNWYGFYSIFIPVYAFLLMPVLSALRGETENFLIRVAEAQWALMISVFCISHVPALLSLNIEGYAGRNMFLIFFLVVVVQSSDVLQYVWASSSGGRKSRRACRLQRRLRGWWAVFSAPRSWGRHWPSSPRSPCCRRRGFPSSSR